MDLLFAEFRGHFGLVQPLQTTVMTFVQPPGGTDRNPHSIHAFQGDPKGLDGPLQDRSEGHIDIKPFRLQQLARVTGLRFTFFRQGNVHPAGESVFAIPYTFAVADQDELVHERNSYANGSWGFYNSRLPSQPSNLRYEGLFSINALFWPPLAAGIKGREISMSMKFFSENMFLIAVAFVSGAMLIWPLVRRGAAGASIDTLRATFLINREDAMVLDVRETNDYANGHILNARNVPLAQLDERANDVAKNKAKPVIVYCANGQRAGGAIAILKKHGFANVVNLSGGFTAWKAAGLPVEK